MNKEEEKTRENMFIKCLRRSIAEKSAETSLHVCVVMNKVDNNIINYTKVFESKKNYRLEKLIYVSTR